MAPSLRGLVAALALALAALSPATDEPARACAALAAPEVAPRVLFIGNSYTRFNNLARMVRLIADSVASGPHLTTSAVTHPGWDLSRHWYADESHAQIRRGRYTHVVLQGHSMSAISEPDVLAGFARLFDTEIGASGARTVLYETWARREGSFFYRRGEGRDRQLEGSDVMQRRITEVYRDVAHQLGAELAPAGRAFMLASQELPEADALLYQRDGSHPTQAGTYLAGLVIYGVIANRDPRSARFRPYPMTRRLSEQLREIAWEAIATQRE